MIAYMRYCLLLCMCFCAWRGYANKIDSLKTQEDVQKFLFDNLGKNGIIYLNTCSEISWTEKERNFYYSQHPPSLDTVFFYGPTGVRETRVVPHYPDIDSTNFEARPPGYPFDDIVSRMDKTPWHFYKMDIDGNRRTDIVVDAGIVIIVMDMGDHIEGHLFSNRHSYSWDSYSFRNFVFLPDGTRALLLRHDYNPCKAVRHSYIKGDVTYITNTVASNKGNTAPLNIDTLYKISSGYDTDRLPTYAPGPVRMTLYPFSDTVDMQLYNITDTIVYKFNGFTNYKPGFKPVGISKIDYDYINPGHDISSITLGVSCLEINKNGKCFLQYPGYYQYYSAMLDSISLQNILNFISYIDIKSMKDFYLCEAMFGTSGLFTVYFDDGTIKKINISSYHPPMALGYLSKSLSDISWSLNWQPSEKPQDFEYHYQYIPVSTNEMDHNAIECKCTY
jgi:hypothetical protein